MAEEIKQNSETGKEVVKPETNTTDDYLAAIKELKENSVNRAEYDKLRADNKKLLQAVVNGQTIEVDTTKAEEPSLNELDKIMLEAGKNGLSNIEVFETSLKEREAAIAKGLPDPYVTVSSSLKVTQADFTRAQEIADIYRECIDEANGNDEQFILNLKRRMR